MVIITMNRGAALESGKRPPINDDPILEFVRLDAKLGCTTRRSATPSTRSYNVPNWSLMALMWLHSLTHWFAMSRILKMFSPTPPSPPSPPSVATAPTTTAVKNASVMGSMSTSPMALSVPIGGPVTVVSVAVCTTVHPIGSSTSFAKRASPWRDDDPIEVSVHDVPVMAATASG